jgi:hypothetical protein
MPTGLPDAVATLLHLWLLFEPAVETRKVDPTKVHSEARHPAVAPASLEV